MNETKPKKMVSRNVAVALGIICVILVVSLAGTIAYYTSTVNGKDNKISSLSANITSQNVMLNLNDSTVLLNNYTFNSTVPQAWNYTFRYAGYLFVSAYSSLGGTISLSYTFQSLNYDGVVDFGFGTGTAIFPVLPHSNVWLTVFGGTPAPPIAMLTTVNATYYY